MANDEINDSLLSVADLLLDILSANPLWEIADCREGNAFVVSFVIADTLTRFMEITGNGKILEKSSIRIVHGRPLLRSEPYPRFDHSWVELSLNINKGEEDAAKSGAVPEPGIIGCIDFSNGIRVIAPADAYYAVGAINEHELDKYTLDAYKSAALSEKHTGPFEKKSSKTSKPN